MHTDGDLIDVQYFAGFRVYDSTANFIFFCTGAGPDLKEDLLRDNILIRSCENYRGLSAGYYRIAVKTPAENDILINCLKKRGVVHGV